MKIPLLALIFQGIPEDIGLAYLAFVIAKIPLIKKRIVLIGIIIAFTSYLLRLLPLTFGIHTVLIIGFQFILLMFIGKGNFNNSIIASLVSVLCLIIIETVCLSLLMPLFGVTFEITNNNAFVRILITLPQVLVLFVLAWIIHKIRVSKEGKIN